MKIGDRVSHQKFGDGIIKSFTDNGNLIIEFEEVGRKKLSAKYFSTIDIRRSSNLKKYLPTKRDELWLKNYEKLVKEINHSPNGRLSSIVNGKPSQTYHFLQRQKRLLKKGLLPRERLEKLKRLKIKDLDINSTYLTNDEKFWNQYNQFKKYLDTYQRMPKSRGSRGDKNNQKLSRWYYKQLARYKKNTLEENRRKPMEKLFKIINPYKGIRGGGSGETYIKLHEEYFILLKDSVDSGLFPKYRNKDGKRNKFRVWLDNQIVFFNTGRMPQDRVKKFNEMGFFFKENKIVLKMNWEESYARVKTQLEKCNDNSSILSALEPKEYGWTYRQKRLFNKGKLSKSKSQKLESLGIKLLHKTNYERWLDKFYIYQESISTGEIINKIEKKKIRDWIYRQSYNFKSNKLLPRQIELLLQSGFELDNSDLDNDWFGFYSSALSLYKDNNIQEIPKKIAGQYSELYRWYVYNLARFKMGDLSDDKDEKFSQLPLFNLGY